jgi:hypothetical protein
MSQELAASAQSENRPYGLTETIETRFSQMISHLSRDSYISYEHDRKTNPTRITVKVTRPFKAMPVLKMLGDRGIESHEGWMVNEQNRSLRGPVRTLDLPVSETTVKALEEIRDHLVQSSAISALRTVFTEVKGLLRKTDDLPDMAKRAAARYGDSLNPPAAA